MSSFLLFSTVSVSIIIIVFLVLKNKRKKRPYNDHLIDNFML